MLSRIAENLYWLARYIERTENTARLVNVQANLMLDLPQPYRFAWQSLVDITGSQDEFQKRYERADALSVRRFLLTDRGYHSSVASSLFNARENMRGSRDGLPKEAWEEFNEFYQQITKRLNSEPSGKDRYNLLNDVISGCQQFLGLLAGTMDRNEGYYFMRLGRNLERADMTGRLIDVRSANLLRKDEELTPFDSIQWMSVLKSLSGYQSYRVHVKGPVVGREVLGFLILNSEFPRAIFQCLHTVGEAIGKLPGSKHTRTQLDIAIQILADAPIRELAGEPTQLHAFVDDIEHAIGEVHRSIADTWFNVGTELPG